jgi:hypothetical protein
VEFKDETLKDIDDVESAEHILEKSPKSLAEALSQYHLSDDGKVLLAYYIAKSTWEHYNSDWMLTRWTTQSIQFLPQCSLRTFVVEHDFRYYDPAQPYLNVRFDDLTPLETALTSERAAIGAVHKAPRIQALGIILVNIFSSLARNLVASNSFRQQSWQAVLNFELLEYGSILKENWLELDNDSRHMPAEIIGAVESCFKASLYGSLSQTAEDRRKLLYDLVVSPLEGLVKHAGLKKEMAAWQSRLIPGPKEVDSNTKCADRRSTSMLHNGPIGTIESQASASWIAKIINSALLEEIRSSYRSEHQSETRIRVAILDTGYCPQSRFFSNKARSNRIQGWHDFVTGSEEHSDSCGHGTHVLSCAMKVAPSADFYVARVAMDAEQFGNASANVAEVCSYHNGSRYRN